MNPGQSTLLDEDDKARGWKQDACMEHLVHIKACPDDPKLESPKGTGWLVRCNEKVVMVTARHVLAGNLQNVRQQKTEVTGTVTAMLQVGINVQLAGCVALVPEPEGGSSPPDVVIVVLPDDDFFPARSLPCNLDIKRAEEVGGDGLVTLLQFPDHLEAPFASITAKVIAGASSGSARLAPWEIQHGSKSDAGSSGGMHIDYQCKAFAVHVGQQRAVLLSLAHQHLGELSPWHGVEPVEHKKCTEFHLPRFPADFVGRKADLEALHEHLRQPHGGQVRVVTASTGLPGVGKSWLLAAYVYKLWQSREYNIIAWIRAERVDDAEQDLIELGMCLKVSNPEVYGQVTRSERAERVREYLTGARDYRVFLVFDNVENFSELERYVPSGSHCRSVFTTRLADRCGYQTLELAPFTSEESLLLLAKVVGQSVVDAERHVAEELCNKMDNLPLAVRVVATYARKNKRTLAEVMADVRRSARSMTAFQQQVRAQGHRLSKSACGALFLSLGDLDSPNLKAVHRLALLAPDRVPVDLLGDNASTSQLVLSGVVSFPERHLVSIHRLIQQVAAARMDDKERQRVANALVEELLTRTQGFSRASVASWADFNAVAPHVAALLDALPPVDPDNVDRTQQDPAREELALRFKHYQDAMLFKDGVNCLARYVRKLPPDSLRRRFVEWGACLVNSPRHR